MRNRPPRRQIRTETIETIVAGIIAAFVAMAAVWAIFAAGQS